MSNGDNASLCLCLECREAAFLSMVIEHRIKWSYYVIDTASCLVSSRKNSLLLEYMEITGLYKTSMVCR